MEAREHYSWGTVLYWGCNTFQTQLLWLDYVLILEMSQLNRFFWIFPLEESITALLETSKSLDQSILLFYFGVFFFFLSEFKIFGEK